MKHLLDILQGFDLEETWDDGTKVYGVKPMHHVLYDYFVVNSIMIRPSGNIDASVGVNCDFFEGANKLDEFHVYELTEIA